LKNREIEYLRAFAILIAAHSHLPATVGLPSMFKGGWPGVDLFFAISGFVITNSLCRLLPEMKEGSSLLERAKSSILALKIFFFRRFARIFPLAVLWLLIPLILSVTFNNAGYFAPPIELIETMLQILTLRFNFYPDVHQYTYAQYWSLMVEEHFYLFFPFMLIAVRTRSNRKFAALVGFLFFAIVMRNFVPPLFPKFEGIEFRQNSLRKFDPIFLGVWIAFLRQEGFGDLYFSKVSGVKKFVFATLAALCILAIWTSNSLLPPSFINNAGIVSVSVLSGILVFLASFQRGIVFDLPILKPILNYLGSRSYGLYLIHWPVLSIIAELQTRLPGRVSVYLSHMYHPWGYFIEFLSVVLILTEMCHRFVEVPFIDWGKRRTALLVQEASPKEGPASASLS
jgi:peptidoglycan/LPS O-acetylase OafA/YrhL